MILTPEVHAEKQCYVVKAALHIVHPIGRAYCWGGADCTLHLLMVLRTWFRLGWLGQRHHKFFGGLVTDVLCDSRKWTET